MSGCPVDCEYDSAEHKLGNGNWQDCPITIRNSRCQSCHIRISIDGVRCRKKWYVCRRCYPQHCLVSEAENEEAIIGKIEWG